MNNILNTIDKYQIDRGIDHYISNICSQGKQELPYNFAYGLDGIPKIIRMNNKLSNNSMRINFDKKL